MNSRIGILCGTQHEAELTAGTFCKSPWLACKTKKTM